MFLWNPNSKTTIIFIGPMKNESLNNISTAHRMLKISKKRKTFLNSLHNVSFSKKGYLRSFYYQHQQRQTKDDHDEQILHLRQLNDVALVSGGRVFRPANCHFLP